MDRSSVAGQRVRARPSASAGPPGLQGALLPALFVIALVIRLIYVLTLEARIVWYDGEEYSRLAGTLLETGRYLNSAGNASAFWPPGYPVFLAWIYTIFGESIPAVRLVQAVLSAAVVPLVFALGRRAVGVRAALLAAVFTAIYPLFIYSAGAFFPVTLQIFLLTASILLAHIALEENRGWRAWLAPIGAGFLSAWAALTAASALPAVFGIAPWMIWARRRMPFAGRLTIPLRPPVKDRPSGSPGVTRPTWRSGIRELRAPLLFLAMLVLVVGSWTARNQRILGHAVLVSNNGGYNLWLGNYPGVGASTGNSLEIPGMKEEADSLWRSNPTEVTRDRAFSAQARRYIRENPGRFLRLTLSKALAFWALYPQPVTEDRPRLGAGGLDLEKLASILSYGVLLPLALFGLYRSLRRGTSPLAVPTEYPPRDLLAPLVLLLALMYTGVHAVVLSKVRFRLPLDPLVILYGAAGLTVLWDYLRLWLRRGAART